MDVQGRPTLDCGMLLLDLTLPTPAENLALDEALLDAAEAGEIRGDVLRLWEPEGGQECGPMVPIGHEPPSDLVRPIMSDRDGRTTLRHVAWGHFVVLGRSSQPAIEANLPACRDGKVPVLRRSSGGAAIVAGPGCLMYGVVLSYERQPELRMLDQAHAHVLSRVAAGLASLGIDVRQQGTSDLVWQGRKVSGNSLRCKRDHLLYHGTLLYDFNLPLVGNLLGTPPRQPEYRQSRSHDAFVANLPVRGEDLRRALAQSFAANEPLDRWPAERTAGLVASRYSQGEWSIQS
jgi:lipoate---protein ligase